MSENQLILQEVRAAQQDARAADTLIEKYLPFIRAEARKFMPGQVDEDAVSIAMFAFYEALMSYQPSPAALFCALPPPPLRTAPSTPAGRSCATGM